MGENRAKSSTVLVQVPEVDIAWISLRLNQMPDCAVAKMHH